MSHDLLTMYSAKAVEYPLALLYLALFIPFWRFVNGGRAAAARQKAAQKTMHPGLLTELFALPEQVFFHPGHAWARMTGDGLVAAGIDDFGQKLVGPVSDLVLPKVGDRVGQGEPAWSLVADGRRIDMLSPVDGTVVAVNPAGATALGDDPYGAGWLVQIRGTRLAANVKHLLSGTLAKRWMEDTCSALCSSGGGQALGAVALDGGVPVGGMAKAIDPDNWDRLAKRLFLS